MDLAEPTEGHEYECPQRPITSSPFRSPAPPLLTTFEGVLSTVSAAAAAADFAVPVPDNLDNLRSEKHLAENAETASSASSASASTGEQSGGSTEDHEESGSSTSSSKRSRARRRKKAHYAKIRDQIAYYFSDANLRHDRFMRSLAGVEEEALISNRNGNNSQTSNQEKKQLKMGGKKRKLDEEKEEEEEEEVTKTNAEKDDQHGNSGDAKPNDESNGEPVNSSLEPRSTDHLSGCRPVPCSAFLVFNKIANLLGNRNSNEQQKEDEDIYRAFLYEQEWTAFGTALLFDAKNRTIARREPFSNDNASGVNDRVVYVEGFTSDQLLELEQKAALASENEPLSNDSGKSKENETDIYDFLKEAFEKHGTVLSIRTPRFRGTKQLMGFAFVEFAKNEAVERAVKYFKKLSKSEALVKPIPVNDTTSTLGNDENKVETAIEPCDIVKLGTSTNESENAPSKPKQQSDENSVKQGVKRKQDSNVDVSQRAENTTNGLGSLSETNQKKVKSVQFQVESSVDGKTDNVTNVKETEKENKGNLAELAMPKKSPFSINQLRVMSKQSWNQYKNRYLKLQRSVAPQTNNFSMNNNYQCEDLLVNLDLARKQQQQKRKKAPLNSTLKRTGQTGKRCSFSNADTEVSPSKQGAGTSASICSNIVQLVLQTNKAQAIESGRIRRNLRTFFETASSSKADDPNSALPPPLPSPSDIAFIDCEHGIHFQTDGSMQLTVFIRTHDAESAAKLVLNDDGDEKKDDDGDRESTTNAPATNFRQLLNAHLGSSVTLKKVALLDKVAIENYWALVNQSKGRNNYNNCNYNYHTNSHKFRNGRK